MQLVGAKCRWRQNRLSPLTPHKNLNPSSIFIWHLLRTHSSRSQSNKSYTARSSSMKWAVFPSPNHSTCLLIKWSTTLVKPLEINRTPRRLKHNCFSFLSASHVKCSIRNIKCSRDGPIAILQPNKSIKYQINLIKRLAFIRFNRTLLLIVSWDLDLMTFLPKTSLTSKGQSLPQLWIFLILTRKMWKIIYLQMKNRCKSKFSEKWRVKFQHLSTKRQKHRQSLPQSAKMILKSTWDALFMKRKWINTLLGCYKK